MEKELNKKVIAVLGLILFFAGQPMVMGLFATSDEAPMTWSIETVDSGGYVASENSLALNSRGRPHISYYDLENRDLKYARWTGSYWSIETVDSAGDVGSYNSLALDSGDKPHISYWDDTNDDLKYARWTGSAWSIQTVDSAGDVGFDPSIALDSGNRPHISYHDETKGDLKYARWTGSAWSIETVDSGGDVGVFSSIALDSFDNPHISYLDGTYNGDLKYAWWMGSAWIIQTVDYFGSIGYSTSIALDSLNNPHISYIDLTNHDLKYATKLVYSPWEVVTLDSAAAVGADTSITLDSSGRPHISYFDWTNYDLKYARRTESAWSIETVDSAGDVGYSTSIALDSLNNPHISYFEEFPINDLKYAWGHTANPEVGNHKVRAKYLQAYLHDDHDIDPPGEWWFSIKEEGGTWSSEVYKQSGDGWCNFDDTWVDWWFTGGTTYYQLRAREHDPGGWDYTSITPKIYATATVVNQHQYTNIKVGDVTHYSLWYIWNEAPTVGGISGPSGVSPGTHTYTATGSDPEGDSITYHWYVDNVLKQSGPSNSFQYDFTAPGTYTVKVRTRDYFGAYSGYSSKTVVINPTAAFDYSFKLMPWGDTYRFNIVEDKWIHGICQGPEYTVPVLGKVDNGLVWFAVDLPLSVELSFFYITPGSWDGYALGIRGDLSLDGPTYVWLTGASGLEEVPVFGDGGASDGGAWDGTISIRLNPFTDIIYLETDIVPWLHGYQDVPGPSPGYPAPLVGYVGGGRLYWAADWVDGEILSELHFLVVSTSTKDGYFIATTDGYSYSGPHHVWLTGAGDVGDSLIGSMAERD